MKRRHTFGIPVRVLIGLALAVLGVLFLISALGLAGNNPVLQWYPVLFILVGIWALLRNQFQQPIGPIVMIAVATAIMLLAWNAYFFWAFMLIVVGLVLLSGGFRSRIRSKAIQSVDTSEEPELNDSPIFDASVRMSGAKHKVVTDRLEKGDISVIMGSAEVDLRGSEIQERPLKFEVEVIMAELKIYVPSNWRVEFQNSTVMGETKDNRNVEPSQSGGPDLIIQGNLVMGEININD